MRRAVVLLSGGLDSAVTLAVARDDGYETYALTLLYGQKHSREVQSARELARALGAKEHMVLEIPLGELGGSSLTDEGLEIPKGRDLETITAEIPSTYVPARNTVLLAFALSWAEILGAEAVYIGANTVDFSGYPDCRPEFYEAFQRVADLGTKSGVEGRKIEIRYPLIRLSKAEIVRRGAELGVPFELTWSCYAGGERACGKCDSCQLRLRGFEEAGLKDPLEYEES